MPILETQFYGKINNIDELKCDLDYCTKDKKKCEITDLLELNNFDYNSYNNSTNTENINFENWFFNNDSRLFIESRTVRLTFETENWDHYDYRPIQLISKLYGLNYRSCTKCNPSTKSSNVSFKEKDYEILEITNRHNNKTYESVIYGNNKQRKQIINDIKSRKKGKYNCKIKKLKDCSGQLISGVYYE